MTPAQVCAALPAMRGWAVRLVGRDGADDLLQDAAERAIRHCGRADPAHLSGWLMAIMRHRAQHLHRSEASQRRRVAEAAVFVSGVVAPAAEPTVLFHEVFAGMPADDAAALARLARGDGPLSNTEKSQIRRARLRLCRLLDGGPA